MAARRYAEIPAVLEKPIAAAPDKFHLQALRAEALLRSGKKNQGVEEAQKIAKATSDPMFSTTSPMLSRTQMPLLASPRSV